AAPTVPSTRSVTNLNDTGIAGDGSLRGQIAAAAPGDVIQFAPGLRGSIALGSTLTLDRNVAVVGNVDAGGNALVTLTRSGWYNYEAGGSTDLAVNPGVTASVSGLTLTGATDHAVWNQGNLTLDHVAITGNQIGYEYYGYGRDFFGTVYNEGILVVRHSTITNN